MNWRHLQAFLWLRWRLMVNQWRRAGAVSAVLMIIIAISLVITAIPVFVGCFALGVFAIPKASPAQLMYVWDGVILVFLFFWGIGVITELQRNDPLSLSMFLHLPVSVNSAFLINFLSSLLRLSLILFVPAMLGYAFALIYVKGIGQWLVLPSLAAFLLMITAPTYQFQGWLASLVNNPRRRRTVVVGVTMGFILVSQLPNLISVYAPRMNRQNAERQARQATELANLQKSLDENQIDGGEFVRRQREIIDGYNAESKRVRAEESARIANIVWIANVVVPAGWLPAGVMGSAEGKLAPALLGLAGMTLIGTASLWRAYRSTLNQYQGLSSSRPSRTPPARTTTASPSKKTRFLEIRIPGISEPVSAIALGGFQSLVRSPEAKLALLSPLIMGGVFGSMLLNGRQVVPEGVRPLLGFAAIAMVLFGLLGLMSNQFGIDRDGFRVYVLSAAPRRDILLGKNLCFVPAAVVLSMILVVAVLVICPMRVDHAVAMVPQFVSMFLLFCFISNLSSIYVPFSMNPGTLKPMNPKTTTVLLQMVMFLILFPLTQGLTMIPLGVEALLNAFGIARGLPVCLLLALVECALVVLLYDLSLIWLGGQLQAREQIILEKVTNRLA